MSSCGHGDAQDEFAMKEEDMMAVVTNVTPRRAKLQSDHHHQHTDNWFSYRWDLPSCCPIGLEEGRRQLIGMPGEQLWTRLHSRRVCHKRRIRCG